MTDTQARRAIKFGVIATCVYIVFALANIFVASALIVNEQLSEPAASRDRAEGFAIAMYLAIFCVYGLHRKSRFAATALLGGSLLLFLDGVLAGNLGLKEGAETGYGLLLHLFFYAWAALGVWSIRSKDRQGLRERRVPRAYSIVFYPLIIIWLVAMLFEFSQTLQSYIA